LKPTAYAAFGETPGGAKNSSSIAGRRLLIESGCSAESRFPETPRLVRASDCNGRSQGAEAGSHKSAGHPPSAGFEVTTEGGV
jgi:hypothetical protein